MSHKCLGITTKGNRCSNKAKYIQNIAGAEFNVCKFHQKNNLLSNWDANKGKINPPKEIRNWLENYYECWQNTGNLLVSARFASSIFKNYEKQLFDQKFEIYVNSRTTNEFVQGECGVCYTEQDVMVTECQHTFCIDCLKEWCNRSITCPVCRTIL